MVGWLVSSVEGLRYGQNVKCSQAGSFNASLNTAAKGCSTSRAQRVEPMARPGPLARIETKRPRAWATSTAASDRTIAASM